MNLNACFVGEGMEQTKYAPNSEAWKLYDPIYTEYRALYQRDVQKVKEV